MTRLSCPPVPASHEVQPLQAGSAAYGDAIAAGTLATCGTCGRSWNDGIATGMTPTPSGRCPFEYFHADPVEVDQPRPVSLPAGAAPIAYREVSGTHYHAETAPDVIAALERVRSTGARVRLFYGDTATGKAWAEESDVVGTLSRSMGAGPNPRRVPLLMRSARSSCGGALLDHCIVAIMTAPDRFAYRHPQFTPGAFKVLPGDVPGYVERVDVDGVNHARFKKPGQAARWVEFMTGKRMAP